MTGPELKTIPGGTRVLCERMPGRESVTVGVWIKTGSRYEPARLQGISHFLEHMLFKGTPRRTSRQISRAIEGIGGSLNGFTSEECTCYWARVRKDHLAEAVDVLLDMVAHPRLTEDDLERERGVILEEMRMYRDNPAYHVHELIQEAMWPDQPLGRSILGTAGTIARMKRSDLANYHSRRYAPDQTAVVACGEVDAAELFELVRGRVTEGKATRRTRTRPGEFARNGTRELIDTRPIEQANLSLGFPGLSRDHPDRCSLILLSIILGGNMSSRLFQEIREKRGWVYSIRSDPESYCDCGDLVISAGLPPEKLEATVKLIGKELRRIREKAPAKSELARAREYYLGQTALSLEKTSSRMFWLGGHLLATGRVATPNELYAKVKAVTPRSLLAMARRVFRPGKCCTAVIGPIPSTPNPPRLKPI